MKRHSGESGYAMLLVFLMAACVAIMLYMELPRVAFQAERQREIQLVDRGNQFKRAIQVFVTDKINNPTHRYPASLDEMESFNNHRYLRRRYLDPMTGKDEWRLVHINGGVLTDSVTTKGTLNAQAGASAASASPVYISQQAFMDSDSNGQAAGGATRALNRRPSESQGAPGDPTAPGGSLGLPGGSGNGTPSGMPNQAGIPGQPGVPGQNGLPNIPGQAPPGMPQQQPAAAPCTVYIGSCPSTPTTASGQQPAQLVPGGFSGLNPGGNPNGAAGGVPGMPGAAGSQTNAQSAAAAMISGLLTSPRPGGMPNMMPGGTIGGGVAGVASKYEAEGIMVINDRTAINEWEYIFDQTKYRAPPNPLTGPAAMPQGQMPGTTPQQMANPTPAGPAAPAGPGGGGGQ